MPAKFQPGDYARIGGNRPLPYPWLRKGRVVRIKAVIPNSHWLGRRHSAYVIQGRRGYTDAWLASYDLRRLDERQPQGRKGNGLS